MSTNLFSRWIQKTFGIKTAQPPPCRGERRPRQARRSRLFLERLEARELLSATPYIVTTTSDTNANPTADPSQPVSLRDAINATNADLNASAANPDVIQFTIPFNDPHHLYYKDDGASGSVSRLNVVPVPTAITSDAQLGDATLMGAGNIVDPDWMHSWWSIQLDPLFGALPAITNPVVIDGYTQAGATRNTLGIGPDSPGHDANGDGDNAVLRIELDGTSATSAGLLALPPEPVSGLDLQGGSSTVRGLVVNNFGGMGIWVDCGFSSNGGFVGPSTGSTVAGNFVGTDVSGTIALGNGAGNRAFGNTFNAGIAVTSSLNNTIGGTLPEDRNLVSGNAAEGVNVADSYLLYSVGISMHGNIVEGNFVGTDRNGTKQLGNASDGIAVTDNMLDDGTPTTIIGGSSPESRNIISGNLGSRYLGQNGAAGDGVYLSGANGARVQGNFIGTDVSGTKPLGNFTNGVQVVFSDDVTVGGTDQVQLGGTVSGAGNLISGNGGEDGVAIVEATHVYVQGNFIGTDYAGTALLGSQIVGVFTSGASWTLTPNIVIGGTDPRARNVISGNGAGVDVRRAGQNIVQGNFIGTDTTGTKSLGNIRFGIHLLQSASGNLIAGNLISGNNLGILIDASSPGGNIIEDNRIGTSSNGGALGNAVGIAILQPSVGNTIAGNTIAYNSWGVFLVNHDIVVANSVVGNSMVANGVDVQFPTTTVNSSSLNPSIYGQPVTLTGFVTVDGAPVTLGTVSFWEGNRLLSVHIPLDATGHASFSTATLSVGGHVIRAVYDGFAFVGTSTGIVNQTVNGAVTAPTVAVTGPSAAVVGQALTVTLTPNDPTPADQAGTFTYNIDWDGDGIFDQTITGPAGMTVTHAYAAAGAYAVQAQATDQDGLASPTSPPLAVTVSDVTSAGVQNVVSNSLPIDPTTGDPTVTLQGTTQSQADALVALFQNPSTPGFTPLQPPAGATTPIDIVVTVGPSLQFNEAALVVPAGIKLQINGGTWIGGSPALTFSSGDLTITGATFVNATNAPTILVSGGHLTLRNDTIQESTGYNQAAVAVTGGTVDLGTASSPGGNTLDINGTGSFIHNTTANPISAVGDTFEVSGHVTPWPAPLTVTTKSSLMLAGNSPPPLTGSVSGTLISGATTYTTAYGDQVTVTLSTAATSASPVGQYAITATLSGASAGNYLIDPATSHTGTMYVVSVGADPSSATGAQSVVFWDNKSNAKLITAADLSSLDVLNLVTQGGAAFDPKAVAQLQAWLSISPNATASYKLAVQLAVTDLNVLTGYAQMTDLVYAGSLLAYQTTYGITGLSSGGFISVQNLMNAANAALSHVQPGAPSSDPNQAYEQALAQVLSAVNANSIFVSQEAIWNLFSVYGSLTS